MIDLGSVEGSTRGTTSSIVTARRANAGERQVCARAAIGLSVEATAIELGIAKTSVVTFRQRAYRRLGVTSPFELCGLVAH